MKLVPPAGQARTGWVRSITVTVDGLTFVAMLVGAVILDGLVRPRPGRIIVPVGRSIAGTWLLCWMMTAMFGLFLAGCGNVQLSAGLAIALLALVVLASNAKHTVLGEPLLFSDLALIGAIFRHPQFYLSAIALWQRVAVGIVAALLVLAVSWLFVPDWQAHAAGVGLMLCGLAMLAFSLWLAPCRDIARIPDAYADVRRHGLWPTLLIYWLRWRKHPDPAHSPPVPRQFLPGHPPEPSLVIVVQCESFADPVDLFSINDLALPGLAFARENAWQWGQLEVSGFGAYTMRTEYGVLFGRNEDELAFRRYDPFLTALGEASHALPAKLGGAGWRSVFVHPHDMRFYNRHRIMPAGGFAELVGESHFAPAVQAEGRYVTDAAVAERIISLARNASGPSLIYAVTIENHGPWGAGGAAAKQDLMDGYLRLARNSDVMLTRLLDELAGLGQPAMLVFFGDHRPSIPGLTSPEGERHTPYVMVRLDASGRIVRGDNRQAPLTPAELHHAILDAILGEPLSREATSPEA